MNGQIARPDASTGISRLGESGFIGSIRVLHAATGQADNVPSSSAPFGKDAA